MPPGHILCATDFSGNASRAFQTAIRVARSCKSTLRVLHVAPIDRASRVGALESQAALDERLERFARVEEVADLAISHRVRHGDPGVEIVRAAVDDAADLIAIGRHSQVASGGWLLGSVTEAVVRTAPCPVIVGEPGAPFGGIRLRRVLCALDLGETASDTLACAGDIARAVHADLLLLHVASAAEAAATDPSVPSGRARRRFEATDPATTLAAFAKGVSAGVRVRSRVVAGAIHPALVEQVLEDDSDLLVVGQHGGELSPRPYVGITTLLLLRQAQCAMLVVPPRQG